MQSPKGSSMAGRSYFRSSNPQASIITAAPGVMLRISIPEGRFRHFKRDLTKATPLPSGVSVRPYVDYDETELDAADSTAESQSSDDDWSETDDEDYDESSGSTETDEFEYDSEAVYVSSSSDAEDDAEAPQ